MKFVSTRGGAPAVGFVGALLAGLAPDGGLYVPETWPSLSPREIAAFAARPYAEVAADILGRFAEGEIDAGTIRDLCADAYATFGHEAVAPLRQLGPGLFLLELFHGPTLAFKDVAMQVLGRLYEVVLRGAGRTLTIVCATSGDTGGAAVEAFAGRADIRIVALFPRGRVSEVQRRFMTTSARANVRAVAVDGDFDACQALLKGLFADEAFVREIDLSAVNSINIVRIIAQSVYYFTAAAALGGPARPVRFAVPTGNFGDAYAGWAARRMGLPIDRLVAATNVNDIMARAVETGVYRRALARPTQSPAMDIQVASNFERLVFDASGGDAAATRRLFERFAQVGEVEIPTSALAAVRGLFSAAVADEAVTRQTLANAVRRTGEAVDPHTAVALAAAWSAPREAAPMVVLSTAHAAKFPEAVAAATGQAPAAPAAVLARLALPERIDALPDDLAALKTYLRAFASACP